MKPKSIKNKDLPQADHVDFLEELEESAMKAFDYVMSKAIGELLINIKIKQLSNRRLRKADDLKTGWTGKVPKVELNFSDVFDKTIQKYMSALKWILMGDAGGRAAREAAKSLDLYSKIVPGVVPSAYLNALDTHRKFYKAIYNTDAPELPKKLVEESLTQIRGRVDKFLDQSFLKLKNSMDDSVGMLVQQAESANTAAVQSYAHAMLEAGESRRGALDAAIRKVSKENVSTPKVSQALREAVERYRDEFSLVVNADAGIASAVGAHQAVNEIYGSREKEPRVAIFSFRDEKTCTFCKEASKRADGSFKLYKISDFQPAGYNFSRKRKDWELCVPPSHYRCRCELIYVPDGFDITNDGSLTPSKK